jgi:Fur family ferric uptake transcriptional regulator
MPAELHVTAAARLRRDGQRYTSNRRALVDVLAESVRPLTIPEIVRASDQVPQSSAYRNLSVLEAAGVVHRVVSTDEFTRFELDEELTDDHHHHLICSRCGSVADVNAPPGVEEALESALAQMVRATGFHPERHRFDLLGVCASCR